MNIEMLDKQEVAPAQNFSRWVNRKNGEQMHVFAHHEMAISVSVGGTTGVSIHMTPAEALQLAQQLQSAANWALTFEAAR